MYARACPAALAAVLLAFAAGQAAAQPAPQPTASEPPVCTTTTTVVRRGEVVLSTETRTRCDDGKDGLALDPSGLLGSLLGGSAALEMKDVRGDWRMVEAGSGRVCRFTLMSATSPLGRRVRAVDCRGPLVRAAGWKLEDDSVGLYQADGALLARLKGDKARLTGLARPGEAIELQR